LEGELNQAELPSPQITREEAVRRARVLAEAIRPYVQEAERIRRMPPAVVEAMLESGLIALLRPVRFGGYGCDWGLMLDCVTEVGQFSGSIGWCFSFLIHHQWFVGYYPEATQAYLYSTDRNPRIVTSFAPVGKVTPAAGGWRLSGDWSFGSGGDHCDWAVLSAMLPPAREGLPPQYAALLLKPGQFRMRDTWFSIGLKGSGSNNIAVDDVFVPDSFALDMGAAFGGQAPGSKFLPHPLNQTPLGAQFQFALLCPMLAAARGAYAAFVEFSAKRLGVLTGRQVAESPMLQSRVGEASGELEAAYTVLRNHNRRILNRELIDPARTPEARRDFAMTAKLALAAVDRLMDAAGGRGLSESFPLGRHWHDVHAMAAHIALNREELFQSFGGQALGVKAAVS
jgi:3-hydroxy-9,10-secoandrosta-1,3,5(10)-triene-9,17-dione monooxygenase